MKKQCISFFSADQVYYKQCAQQVLRKTQPSSALVSLGLLQCGVIRYIYIIVLYHVFVFKKNSISILPCYYYCIFFCSCSISVHFYYLFSIHIIYFIICIYYFSYRFYPFYFLVYFNICILCFTFIFIEFALLLYLPSISILYWYIYLYSVYVPFVVNGRAIVTDLLLLNTKLLKWFHSMEINGYQS